jgi:hypothetical protein
MGQHPFIVTLYCNSKYYIQMSISVTSAALMISILVE